MTTEEKAQKYNEAFRIAQKLYNDPNSSEIGKAWFCAIFPELKESEGEQSKKWILEYLHDGLRKLDEQFKDHFKTAIDWLEKQGEKKSANKVEPKFKVGDWIACEELGAAKILNINTDRYEIEFTDGIKSSPHIDYVCKHFHLWSIKDAEDGDILVTEDNRPFIYKGCLDSNHPDSPVAYCGFNSEGYFQRGGNKFSQWWTDKKVHPATKEQRDALEKAMADAGWEFDFDKKELKKTGQKSVDKPKFKIGDFIRNKKTGKVFYIYHSTEAGFSLANEDKKSFQGYLTEDEYDNYDVVSNNPADYDEMFTSRINSIIDTEIYLINVLEGREELPASDSKTKQNIKNCEDNIGFLNSIRDMQKLAEWGEEDERVIDDAVYYLEHYSSSKDVFEKQYVSVIIDKLKSLRPQKQWKPSEEQVHAFEQVYDWYNNNFAPSETLTSLYNDLKKPKK